MADHLLQENGGRILQEDGFAILLEQQTASLPPWGVSHAGDRPRGGSHAGDRPRA